MSSFPLWSSQGRHWSTSRFSGEHAAHRGQQFSVMALSLRKLACQDDRMRFVGLLQRVLCLLAVLGVMFGPVSIAMAGSAMASSGDISAASNEMRMPAGQPMMSSAEKLPETKMSGQGEVASSDEMPCCPKAKPVAPGCPKNCPLALVCSSMLIVHPSEVSSIKQQVPWRITFVFFHDNDATSADSEPPARPPRA